MLWTVWISPRGVGPTWRGNSFPLHCLPHSNHLTSRRHPRPARASSATVAAPHYAVTIYRYGAGSVLPADMPAESFLHRALARKSAGKIGAGKTVSHPFPVGAGRDRAERVLFRDAPYPGAGAGAAGHLRTDLAGDAAHTNPHRSIVYKPALLSLMHSTAGEVGRRADLHRPPRASPQSRFRTTSILARSFTVGLSITFPRAS